MTGHPTGDEEVTAAFAAGFQPLPQRMDERDFQQVIVALAEKLGLSVFWIPSMARTNIGKVAKTAKGWLDLSIGGPGGMLFREIKSRDGEIRAEQQLWLWLHAKAGHNAGIWRPDDWESGRIRAELEAIA